MIIYPLHDVNEQASTAWPSVGSTGQTAVVSLGGLRMLTDWLVVDCSVEDTSVVGGCSSQVFRVTLAVARRNRVVG